MENSDVIRESALIWLGNNTNIDITQDPLPANVELFISRYGDVLSLRPGVSSESIQGLSQSFTSGDIGVLLRQYASSLLGEDCLTCSDAKAFPALEKWVD